MFNIADYPGQEPMVVTTLNIPDQHAVSDAGNNQQRSDGRMGDPLRVMTLTNRDLPRVTLVLSNL